MIKEVESYLTEDYIYLPFNNINEINLKSENVLKGDKLVDYSPVSGTVKGTTKINSTNNVVNTIVIENNFKDEHKSLIQNENIYKLDKPYINSVINLDKDIYININNNLKYDVKDSYLLKDNVKVILETINLLTETYNIKAYINLNKKDITTFETLFNYINAYPNINIVFNKNYKEYFNLYDVLDIYNKLKNRLARDYIYLSIVTNEVKVIKIKKYSNLKEILSILGINGETIYINGKLEINELDFLLDESVSFIVIKESK